MSSSNVCCWGIVHTLPTFFNASASTGGVSCRGRPNRGIGREDVVGDAGVRMSIVDTNDTAATDCCVTETVILVIGARGPRSTVQQPRYSSRDPNAASKASSASRACPPSLQPRIWEKENYLQENPHIDSNTKAC